MSQQLGQCDPVSCTQDQRDDVLWTALHRESHSLSVLTESVQSTVSPRSLLLSPPICPVTARGHHLDDASDDRMYVILSPCLSVSVCLCLKLQALVYDILPSTTAVFSYAIGSRKLSANEQFFFVGAQTVVSLL